MYNNSWPANLHVHTNPHLHTGPYSHTVYPMFAPFDTFTNPSVAGIAMAGASNMDSATYYGTGEAGHAMDNTCNARGVFQGVNMGYIGAGRYGADMGHEDANNPANNMLTNTLRWDGMENMQRIQHDGIHPLCGTSSEGFAATLHGCGGHSERAEVRMGGPRHVGQPGTCRKGS